MAVYAIGDVQGCFKPLQQLLQLIDFDQTQDELWFAGDLVNRGPHSLTVLRFIKNLPRARIVLGNHDLHLLALANGHPHRHHTLQDVLSAPDRDEIIDWLRHQPLFYYDEKLDYAMVHAGLPPQWDLAKAQQYAREVEAILQSDHYFELLKNMYGNELIAWHESLTGWQRLRFIVNAFTRIRFCDLEGRLDLQNKKGIETAATGFMPWFNIPNRASQNLRIIFGHWAALKGNINAEKEYTQAKVYALDTGCVWGGCLTAMCLDTQQRFSVKCEKP